MSEQNNLHGTEEEVAKDLSETQTVSLINNNLSFIHRSLVVNLKTNLISNAYGTA